MKKTTFAALLALAGILSSCATARLMRGLDPDSREFISKARYLITPEEKKIFLALPASDRLKFIEEFWLKRDPDPDTEENEFKTQYFQRIEEANRLFSEGGPGWLQDRGRIYILLGPPTERLTFPRGTSFYDVPTEIWYYGFFEMIFIDPAWNGNYRLDPTSPQQLAVIMSTQLDWKPKVTVERGAVDFAVETGKGGDGQGWLRAKVPYRKIWLKAVEKILRTTLSLDVEIQDAKGGRVQAFRKDYVLELTEKQLEEVFAQDYLIEIPLALAPGTYTVKATLTNLTDESKVQRTVKLAL